MKPRLRNLIFILAALIIILTVSHCGNKGQTPVSDSVKAGTTDPWMGHRDTARYVGINTCKQCHSQIYESFLKTGMGQSFDTVSREKSAAKFEKHTVIYDKESNLYYHPFWDGNSYCIREFRLSGKDTVFLRTEKVNYIIGSGQHTNSHIFSTNGYLHQMPMTFYTQKGTWDLPPGFENGSNTRFSRKIGLECMSCHNAYPEFVEGSENKYSKVMHGIDCERCHGPGSIHVALKQTGVMVDTSKAVDYSIVNPGKLTVDRQFDVCMRCHLQGNAILKPGKTFFDFKPGMVLSDFMTVFMPRYQGGDNEFIMASHAARLKMSKCFIQSLKTADSSASGNLRPYKDGLTCVTCHNPHVSVKVTGKEVFNRACTNCHQPEGKNKTCSATAASRKAVEDNCVGCHMPRSGSIDIPHVSVHDHYIRKPQKKEDVGAVKKFIGIYAVNDNHPSALTRARGYVNYYEKFNPQNPALLDSALYYLKQSDRQEKEGYAVFNQDIFACRIQVLFLKREFSGIAKLTYEKGNAWVLENILKRKGSGNGDAWTAYRIGEAYSKLGKKEAAREFYSRAVKLEPFNLDFENKLGIALLDLNRKEESAGVFDFILKEDEKYASAFSNRGRIYFYDRNFAEAERCFKKALALDPDMLDAMKNEVDVLNETKQYEAAKTTLLKIIKRFPADKDAPMLLEKMKALNLIK